MFRVLLLLLTTTRTVVDGWSQNIHRSRIKPKRLFGVQSSLPSISESDLQLQEPEEDSTPSSSYYGLNDTDFEAWIKSELFLDPLSRQYPDLFEGAATAITKWRKRYRGNPALWRRLFKKDRVLKEFVEAAPILNAVVQLIQESKHLTNFTIIDLASGKGYLSMFLSELLPPEKVQGLVLMDKAWPRRDQPLQKDHHISWEHIYGNDNTSATTFSYYDTTGDIQTRLETKMHPSIAAKTIFRSRTRTDFVVGGALVWHAVPASGRHVQRESQFHCLFGVETVLFASHGSCSARGNFRNWQSFLCRGIGLFEWQIQQQSMVWTAPMASPTTISNVGGSSIRGSASCGRNQGESECDGPAGWGIPECFYFCPTRACSSGSLGDF
jgi:hypothetical protein